MRRNLRSDKRSAGADRYKSLPKQSSESHQYAPTHLTLPATMTKNFLDSVGFIAYATASEFFSLVETAKIHKEYGKWV
jgi:hypothetical protein